MWKLYNIKLIIPYENIICQRLISFQEIRQELRWPVVPFVVSSVLIYILVTTFVYTSEELLKFLDAGDVKKPNFLVDLDQLHHE